MQESLRNLDLTAYESRVLLSLAQIGPAAAREVSDHSKVPKNKVYDVLRKLEQRNLVVTLPVTPRKYKVENLEKLSEIIARKKKELDDAEQSIANLKKSMLQKKEDFFWVIKGQKAIQERLRLHDREVRSEILSVDRLSKFLPGNMQAMRAALHAGVRVRMLCVVDQKNYANVLRWRETGADIRVYNSRVFGDAMPRFSVFDSREVRITIGTPEITDPDEYLSLWTVSPALAQLFRNYFRMMWEKSLPLEDELEKLQSC